jgi:predicted transcriptional regulator
MADLKNMAKQYWLEGCNIVLLKGKEPLHKWSQWQTERQNEIAFEALPWSQADGFAIVCGQQLNDGTFIGVVDADVQKPSGILLPNTLLALKHLPITQTEGTPSGGRHHVYKSRKKPSTISKYHDVSGLELLGEGRLCIMHPSKGYKKLNDSNPTVVEDLEKLFLETLEKVGVKVEKPSQAWFDRAELSKEPYRGRDPPCIQTMLRGTKIGNRNKHGIRLASYFINFKGYKPDTVRKEILKNWNKLNEPALSWKELDELVKNAVQYGYVFGCTDEVLLKFCKKEECPLFIKSKVVFDEETKEKARLLLRDPAFFYKLGRVFECGFTVPKINKPRFVIGEERNKRLLGFLLKGAAKHGMTSIIKVLGEPGTAKDTMVRMWLKLLEGCFKAAERSYFTAATLRYSEELQGCDLLYIPDSPELTGEKGRHLRFMRADDGGLISEYALKDPDTGEMTTKTVTLPVKAVATTSNAVTGDTALESGMWTLHTNGSPELTKKVKLEKLKFRAGKRNLFPEELLKVWQCAFWLMLNEEPMEELPKIPFAEKLAELLASERSESRRDPDKLCDLISVVAWARRFQKPKEKWAEADWADLYIALQLGLDAITETISDLDVKEQQIFNCVKEGMSLIREGKETKTRDVTSRYVADQTGIPYKTCYRLLEKMVEKGFLNKDKRKGKNVYSVFREKEPKEFLIGVDISQNSPDKLLEQVLSFVGDFSPSHGGEKGGYSLIDPLTGDRLTVGFNDGKPTVQSEPCSIVYPPSDRQADAVISGDTATPTPSQGGEKVRTAERGMEKVSNGENEQKEQISQLMRSDLGFLQPEAEQEKKQFEDWVSKIEGNRVYLKTGEVWFICQFCKGVGKPIYFATEADLERHIKRLHTGYLTKLEVRNS